MKALLLALWLAPGCAHAAKVERCGEPVSQPRSLPDGRQARISTHGSIPGIELLATTEEPIEGGICLTDSRRYLSGAEAFRAGQAQIAGADARSLALLSMVTLERGVAAMAPWTDAASSGGRSPRVNPSPPSLDGDTLRYWRPHAQTADFVYVTLNLSTLALSAQSEADLASSGQDPIEKARKDLQADDLPTRQGAVRVLAASSAPEAQALLLDAAQNNSAALVRKEAVRLIGEKPPAQAVATLSQILSADPKAEVRSQAAVSLGRIGGAEARAALEKAAASDPDPGVKSQARAALSRLGP